MILVSFLGGSIEDCIPRESGDDPFGAYHDADSLVVFPARAGMIPRPPSSRSTTACIPRESGDDPPTRPSESNLPRYSPRERG